MPLTSFITINKQLNMKKIYMRPEFTTIDLGETAAPLCVSGPNSYDVSGDATADEVLNVGPSNPWENSSWKPADIFNDEEEF